MLPESILCLISVTLAYAQRPQLAVNSVTSHNTLRELTFAIPAQQQLSISVAVCSDSTALPRFFVTNTSNADSQAAPGPDIGADIFEIALNDGQGNWTGSFTNGGVLSAVSSSAAGVDYDIGVSSDGKPLKLSESARNNFAQASFMKPWMGCHSSETLPPHKLSYFLLPSSLSTFRSLHIQIIHFQVQTCHNLRHRQTLQISP
jgi:hypothetical protein